MARSRTTHSAPGRSSSGTATTLTMTLFHSGRRSMSVSSANAALGVVDTMLVAVPVPPMAFPSVGVAGEEGVAEHLVGAGLLLALRTAERIDGLTDGDVDEPDLGEDRRPACARQASGDSAGQQIDVARGLGRHRSAVGDVGELEIPAGSQDPPDLTEHGAFVGTQVDDPVRDDDVGPAVFDWHRLEQPGGKFDVVQTEGLRRRRRLDEHLGGHVDPDDVTVGPDLTLRDEGVEARTRPRVDDPFAGRERPELEQIADAGEGLHRPLGQRVDDRHVVAETSGGDAPNMEVVGRRRGGPGAVATPRYLVWTSARRRATSTVSASVMSSLLRARPRRPPAALLASTPGTRPRGDAPRTRARATAARRRRRRRSTARGSRRRAGSRGGRRRGAARGPESGPTERPGRGRLRTREPAARRSPSLRRSAGAVPARRD